MYDTIKKKKVYARIHYDNVNETQIDSVCGTCPLRISIEYIAFEITMRKNKKKAVFNQLSHCRRMQY